MRCGCCERGLKGKKKKKIARGNKSKSTRTWSSWMPLFDEGDCQQTPCPNPSAVRCDVQRGVRPKVKEHKRERESIIGFLVFGFSVQGGGQTIIDPGGGCGRGATCVDYERCGTTTNRAGARSGPKALLSFLCFPSFFLSLLSDGGAKKTKKEKKKNQERMLPLLNVRVRLANRGSCNCRLEVATVTT